jgi:hypothetical protein
MQAIAANFRRNADNITATWWALADQLMIRYVRRIF